MTKTMLGQPVIEALLGAPDSQLDASMKPLIKAWGTPPTARQILDVLDRCIYSSLASGFIVQLLQSSFNFACKQEGTTLEEIRAKPPKELLPAPTLDELLSMISQVDQPPGSHMAVWTAITQFLDSQVEVDPIFADVDEFFDRVAVTADSILHLEYALIASKVNGHTNKDVRQRVVDRIVAVSPETQEWMGKRFQTLV